MTGPVDRGELCAELAALLAESDVRAGLGVLCRDAHFVADFLAGARGARRGLGVVTDLLHDPSLRRANRLRLSRLHRASPLNFQLTTAFGHEVTRLLLMRAVADATAAAPLEAPVRQRRLQLLEGLLGEGQRMPGALEQHRAMLARSRAGLPDEAREALEYVEMLSPADYEFSACLAAVKAASVLAGCAAPVIPVRRRAPAAEPAHAFFAAGRGTAATAFSRPH